MGLQYSHLLKTRSYLGCLLLLNIGCVTCISLAHAVPLADRTGVNQQRESAVQQAKQGQLIPAIEVLKKLHQQYPNDVKVIADLIVVQRLAGQNAAIVQLTRKNNLQAQAVQIPVYAHTAWLGALRDERQSQIAFDIARQLVDQRTKQQASTASEDRITFQNWPANMPFDLWYYTTLAAEAGQTQLVQQLIPLLENDPQQSGSLDADQYARLAYIQRLTGLNEQAVTSSQKALILNPQQRLALEQQFAALNSLNKVSEAYQLALQHPEVFPASSVWPVKAEWLSLNLQAALKQKEALEAQGQYQQARDLLDQNLLKLQQALDKLDKNQTEYLPLYNDYLYTLRVRELMSVLVNEYQQLSVSEQFQLQPYAKRAVADAYLALGQPQQAHAIYQYLLDNLPEPDAELFIADYYALIDQEKYNQAGDLLKRLDQQFPAMPAEVSVSATDDNRVNSTTDNLINSNARKTRVRVEQVLALDAAYRNRLDIAGPLLQHLVQENPDNINLANDYATILNWRGLPEASEQVVQQAYIQAPYNVGLDLTHATNARDLQHYIEWQSALAKAAQKAPQNSGVLKGQQEWQDRKRVTLQSNLNIGHSKADKPIANSINGSRDREWYTRINSPWLDSQMIGNWRIFADHQDRWADLEPTHQRDQRLGVGAEWQQDRKNAWFMVNQQFDTSQTGFGIGWSHWLNDHWRYRLGFENHSSQIPLRALESGLKADSYQAGLDWRQHESRSASFGYQALDISDGNLRQSVYAAFNQRLFANEYHMTTGGLEAFYDTNSQPGGSYFNPDHSLSYGVNLSHDWLTWRRDSQSFNQHFKVATGISKQAGFSGKNYLNALYQHEWQLNRTWQISYGIGRGSQVYDGNREQRTYGVLGLTGAF